MTKEDIIKGLEQLLATSAEEILLTDDETEVVRSAISALSENKTQMIDKSSFDTEQYKADLQSAYDCGYNKALSENKGDLISRQAVLDSLKEHRALFCDNTPDTFSKLSYAEKSRVDELDTVIATIINLPSVESKGEFDGMTNGKVMMALFPNENKEKLIWFHGEEWWNAPYQKGGE